MRAITKFTILLKNHIFDMLFLALQYNKQSLYFLLNKEKYTKTYQLIRFITFFFILLPIPD